MMKIFYNAWEKICSDFDNEQTFKLNIITFGFEDHLASKNLMDFVGEEMLIFRNQLLKSTVIATIKEPHLKILKPEGVWYNPRKGEAPMDEGCELFNVDDWSLEEDEEINSGNNLSGSEATETADININDDISIVVSNSNDEVLKETTINELPSALPCNLGILHEINQIVKKSKKLAQTN